MKVELMRVERGWGWNWTFKWRPVGGVWRHIHQNNVVPSQAGPEGYGRFRDALNRVHRGETVVVEAEFHNPKLQVN